MHLSSYSIHGVPVQLATDSPAVEAAARTLLRHFAAPAPTRPAVEMRFWEVGHRDEVPVQPSAGAQVLYAGTAAAAGDGLRGEWRCTLYREGKRRIADFHDQGLLLIDDEEGCAEGYLAQPEAMHPDVRISFLQFALVELLKRQGLYTLHAAALERNGRAVLIPGDSGRGKTTCCLSLLRAGYRCLSDDHPLVRHNGVGPEVLSFPVKIDVTESSLAFFPELVAAKERLSAGVRKRYFYAEEFYPGVGADVCRPALLLFPRVVDAPRSHLEPMPRSRALEEVCRQGLLVFDKEVARRQFEAYSRLVEQTACYRLYFGADVLELPRLIDPLLEANGQA
jgi:hypothetical protein